MRRHVLILSVVALVCCLFRAWPRRRPLKPNRFASAFRFL